jgi:hypothetical protein
MLRLLLITVFLAKGWDSKEEFASKNVRALLVSGPANETSIGKILAEFGAEVVPLENPQLQKVNYYRARKLLATGWPDSYMLPQSLPLEESIVEVAKEAKEVPKEASR